MGKTKRVLGGLLMLTALGALACSAAPGEAGGELEAADAEPIGTASEALSKNALSSAQQATVLKLVDDICGDTWCEGDHNFRFQRIRCEQGCNGAAGTCRLTLQFFEHGIDPDVGPSVSGVCKTRGFAGFESLVQTSANGFSSLQPDYYDALSECINRLEAEAR